MMAQAIGASGVCGVAFEVTPGTYVAPAKFLPILSESLKFVQDNKDRRPIRNTPGLVGVVQGNSHIEGDLELEGLPETLAWLLQASRCTLVKSGTGPYVYTFTPSAIAVPVKTLSISIRRNAEVFGYLGCSVTSWTVSVEDDGSMKIKVSIIGLDEATQAAFGAITWPTTAPYGAGMYNFSIPTATQVFDADGFEFSSDDGGEAQFRLASNRRAVWVKFGESNATMKCTRDFIDRTDYDTFKALTSQSITFTATNGAAILTILSPVSIKDSYEVALGGQADAVRAAISWKCVIDGTGKHYSVVVTCAENIT